MPSRRTRRQARYFLPVLTPPRRRSRRTAAAPRPKAAAPRPKVATAPRSAAKGTWQQATYRGRAGVRSYFVYLPRGLRRRTRVPLVVLLHGCAQTPVDFAVATRFNELADRHRFIVVYPQQTAWNHKQRCWHWYESAHQVRGFGEPAIIAGITRAVTAETTRWRIDPTRVYVAGLSAGGGMALVLAVTYPDVYAAVGAHSAPAYRSASAGRNAPGAMAGHTAVPPPDTSGAAGRGMPPTILFHGTLDNVVHARNGQRVAEQWLAYRRAHTAGPKDPGRITRNRTSTVRRPDGRTCTVSRWYTARRRKVLEYWQVDGLAHAWSGGARGGSYSDPLGPRASTVMWSFFSATRLPPESDSTFDAKPAK